MVRRLILAIALASACARPETPTHPPVRRVHGDVAQITPPPPPPPPDYSYAPVPDAIARVLADPDATIEVLVLTSGHGSGPTFRGFSIARRKTLHDVERDRVAAALTSAVTYGKLSGFCSSFGIGFHLASTRAGAVDVWIDPSEGRVEILGKSPQVYALSMSGVRLFSRIIREFSGEPGCG